MVEMELGVVVVVDGEAEVQELERPADVELDVLADGGHRWGLEVQEGLHATAVDGTGPHPLGDGDLGHPVSAVALDEMGHPRAVDHVATQQELTDQQRQVTVASPR